MLQRFLRGTLSDADKLRFHGIMIQGLLVALWDRPGAREEMLEFFEGLRENPKLAKHFRVAVNAAVAVMQASLGYIKE